MLTRQFCLKRTLLLDRLAGFVVSLTRPSHSQERVWYFTVQLIVLADSGCRVYTRSHRTQTTYTFGGRGVPHESCGVWNKPLHCKVPDSLSVCESGIVANCPLKKWDCPSEIEALFQRDSPTF